MASDESQECRFPRLGIPGVHIVVSGLFTLLGTVKTLPIQTLLFRSHVAWKEPDLEGSHGRG